MSEKGLACSCRCLELYPQWYEIDTFSHSWEAPKHGTESRIPTAAGAFDACEKPGGFPLPPGRSGFEFIAKLIELEHFTSSDPAFKFDYCGASESAIGKPQTAGKIKEEHKFRVTKPFSPVHPYRSLDASKLKLSGGGAWDMQEYLESILWLPFQDPAILLHHEDSRASGPDFKHEDAAECLRLARLWDSKGLLAMFPHQHPLGLSCRVFNAHKSDQVDRQIGDRR